jgi:serine protease Do
MAGRTMLLCLVAGASLWGQEASSVVATSTTPSASAASAATLDLKSLEQRARETLDKVVPAIVAVSGGSGVIVTADGYVLSAAHVGVRPNRRVSFTFADGRVVRGRTLGNDQGVDAGLMKIDGDGPFPFVPMGTSTEVQAGSWCLALGYPVSFERGKPPALRLGRVLASRPTMMVTDCTIMGGDSGGPLLDLDGNLIGISSRCDDRLTTNIHVPVDCFRAVWDRLKGGEDFNSLRRVVAYLGVDRTADTDDPRIGRVFPGSSAEKAGVQVGDVIVKFAGQEITRYSQLPPLIEACRPGEEVEMEIRRGDERVSLRPVLGERDDW